MSSVASTVLVHALSPRNGGAMEAPDAVGNSSLAGRPPYVTIFLRITRQTVAKAQFQTFGCGYSIACCSVLTELAAGRSISECRLITRHSILEALVGVPEEKEFCADMAIDALRAALSSLPITSSSLL